MFLACSNMFNSEHEGFYASPHLGPRISFSHDFADIQPQATIKHEVSYKEAPVSSDFQFSVHDHSMIPADEIFSKGKMLPLKNKCYSNNNNNNNNLRKTTLREELLVEDDSEDLSPKFNSSPGRWRDRWNLKRSNFGPKRGDKSEVCLGSVVEEKASIFTLADNE